MLHTYGWLNPLLYSLFGAVFVVGVMRTCGNFAEVKRPAQALKLFIRFALAKGASIIFSLFAAAPPVVNPAVMMVWSYVGELSSS